jgi:hypothetical protein
LRKPEKERPEFIIYSLYLNKASISSKRMILLGGASASNLLSESSFIVELDKFK